MCGIWVSIGLPPLPKALDLIGHRGPDGGGVRIGAYHGRPVVVGHVRLAIQDPSPRSDQPMVSEDERWWLSFNGEILNYLELRREIESGGGPFRTTSDTEVLLRAVSQRGPSILERIRGFFAFVLIDMRDGVLYAARDRYGIKPLYWTRTGDGICFASEAKQFLAVPGFRPRLNRPMLDDYLTFGLCDHTTETFFADVFQVGPGELLQLDLGGTDRLQPRRVRWAGAPAEDPATRNGGATDGLRSALQRVVELNLRADVEVGVALSGGLDSSSIAALASRQLCERGRPLSTCGVMFDQQALAEEHFARLTAAHIGAAWHRTTVEPDELIELFRRVLWHFDEPVVRGSMLAQHKLFQLFRQEGLKVALTGQGGDELLCGYPSMFVPALLDQLTSRGFRSTLRELRAVRAAGMTCGDLRRGLWAQLLPAAWLDTAFAGFRHPAGTVARHLGLKMDPFLARARAPRTLREVPPIAWGGALTRVSYALSRSANLRMLLHYEDRNGMAHGVECRPVLLDPDLERVCLSIPAARKLSDGFGKSILRHVLADLLPGEVANRRDKLGFPVPEAMWQATPFGDWMRSRALDGLDAMGTNGPHVIDPQHARRSLAAGVTTGLPVWALASIGEWVHTFGVCT
jgi:asparagine synthase (glutamine-hydrolysing)